MMTGRLTNVSSEWYTPRSIFDALGICFDTDAASPPTGRVPWVPASLFISPMENGLTAEWNGRVWLNPPYGRGIEQWTKRMIEHANGVLLSPVRTDTRWWQSAAENCDVICFISGRVKFVAGIEQPPGRRSPTDRPGASNCLFAFGNECADAVRCSKLGVVFSRCVK